MPYISVPAYWVFGRSKFQGYVLARRADLTETHPITAQFRSNLTSRDLIANPRHGHNLLSEKLAAMPFTTGNDAELLVDGQATFDSFFEGIVGDEYLGKNPNIGPWRDTHVKVTGPVVQEVQMAFLEDWHWATKETLQLNWDPQPAPSGSRRIALALPTGPADRLETCTLFYLNAINVATSMLWLATP